MGRVVPDGFHEVDVAVLESRGDDAAAALGDVRALGNARYACARGVCRDAIFPSWMTTTPSVSGGRIRRGVDLVGVRAARFPRRVPVQRRVNARSSENNGNAAHGCFVMDSAGTGLEPVPACST